MSKPEVKLADVLRQDKRYAHAAYLFIFEALEHTQDRIAAIEVNESPRHVTGRELLEGVRDLALREFGLMAHMVMRVWGVRSTADVGEIVFNLIEAGLLSKNENDDRSDFRDVFDWEETFREGFEITLDPVSWLKSRERR